MNRHCGIMDWEGVESSREEPEICWGPWKDEGPREGSLQCGDSEPGLPRPHWAGLCLCDSGSLVCYLQFLTAPLLSLQ